MWSQNRQWCPVDSVRRVERLKLANRPFKVSSAERITGVDGECMRSLSTGRVAASFVCKRRHGRAAMTVAR